MGITKRQIDAAAFDRDGPRQQIIYDGALPGFGVRLYPTGAKSFVLRYRTAVGRLRFMTIGSYGVMTPAQAQKEAKRHLLSIGTGGDPVAKREEARRGHTLQEFADVYIERHAKPHKKTWREDRRILDRAILPALGNRKLKSIRRADVSAYHSKYGETAPYQANRHVALLSVLFNCAVDWGYLPDEFPNPTRRIKKFREQSRDRYVTPQELPRLLEAIVEEESVYLRGLFLLYLLTGARRAELLGARWSQVDFEARALHLVDTKAGRPHVIPLAAPAISILEQLPREDGNPHVFPGNRRGRPLVNVGKPWGRIRSRAGLEDVRLHDLRRTVGSWLAHSGESLQLIAKVLNHTNLSTTQVYARIADTAAREALEQHGAHLMSLSGKRSL